ncbi:MAG TPA: hypothetical protein VJO13_09060 [Ktedonobacterales bacterium]|nr:hypothetical protein [Ktedonobacterales bacterium]
MSLKIEPVVELSNWVWRVTLPDGSVEIVRQPDELAKLTAQYGESSEPEPEQIQEDEAQDEEPAAAAAAAEE